MRTVQQPPQVVPIGGLWPLFRIWASIGLQSFGGGASTIFLIQREFIEKRKWLTLEEFAHHVQDHPLPSTRMSAPDPRGQTR